MDRKYVPALFEERKNGELVVENPRRGILEVLHDPPHVGHPGEARMYELVAREWYWPGMYEDVKAYVSHCDSCQRVKARNTLPAWSSSPFTNTGYEVAKFVHGFHYKFAKDSQMGMMLFGLSCG
jgi:hypothetical protein